MEYIETFTPTLLWSQNYNNIEIEINLPNISNELFNFENNYFNFKCSSNDKKYLINFELYGEIGDHTFVKSDKKIKINI